MSLSPTFLEQLEAAFNADMDELEDAIIARLPATIRNARFDEAKIKRHPKGSERGGEFAPKNVHEDWYQEDLSVKDGELRHLTPEERQKYLQKMARKLGFPADKIKYAERQPADAEKGSTVLAGYRDNKKTITVFGAAFTYLSERDMRRTLAHEVTHAQLHKFDDAREYGEWFEDVIGDWSSAKRKKFVREADSISQYAMTWSMKAELQLVYPELGLASMTAIESLPEYVSYYSVNPRTAPGRFPLHHEAIKRFTEPGFLKKTRDIHNASGKPIAYTIFIGSNWTIVDSRSEAVLIKTVDADGVTFSIPIQEDTNG